MQISCERGDITAVEVDAVVNAANSTLLGGGGVDGAIHARGGPQILAECRGLRERTFPDGLPVGEAVATTAGRLPARWVIHTVGPVYSTRQDRAPLLRRAYVRSIQVADELEARSIAFPAISAGAYGWPLADAATQAMAGVHAGLPGTGVRQVRFVLFSDAALAVFQAALDDGPG